MNTTKLNKTTQKAKRWIEEYFNSSCFSVDNFYGCCSCEKRLAERQIKEYMYKNDLHNYRVLNGSSYCFTVGYTDRAESILYIETVSNIYEINLRG
jgi:hypothetical protein